MKELPVGKNLVDHPFLSIHFTQSNVESIYYNLTEEKVTTYLDGKADGILSEIGSSPQAYFVSTVAKASGETQWPDIQINCVAIKKDITNPPYAVVGVRPKSVGELILNASAYLAGQRDSLSLALINPKYLEHPDDEKLMLEG